LIRYDKDGNQFDEMIYNYENTASSQNYKTNTNKLRWVDDTEPVADHTSDIDDQDIGNYTYDDIGQLIADESEEIANIEWTVYGKVRSVTRKPNSIKPDLEFAYDANGNRVLKSVKNKDGSINITTYLRDASGNVLSIYENNIGATATLAEQFVYGSSRVGTLKPVSSIGVNSHSIGLKEYEVIDHLSNVRVVLSDRQVSGNANVISATDYLPFGMAARIYNNENYRYSFNTQEKIDELGEGHTTAFYWEYDGRTGRRWNLDPKPNASISDYACFANNPIWNIDPNGDTIIVNTKSGKYLFRLDDGKPELRTMTAQQVYDQATQWFEPLADNYMKMIDMNKDIATMPELRHFTWEQIANFAEEDRWMPSYSQGNDGDWKSSEEGANGFLMVTVDGKPYWGDAVGQIPFAVDYFTDMLQETGSYSTALEATLQKGMEYGEGELFGGEADHSNTYDNYFILSAALWAGQRYKAGNLNEGLFSNSYDLNKTNYSPKKLGGGISKYFKDKYLKGLKSNQTKTEK
jgi:hypothetical protein